MTDTKTIEDTLSPRWRWRRRIHAGIFHQFLGDDPESKSRCGIIKYSATIDDRKTTPLTYQRCRSCDKMSRGLAGNAKTY